MELPRDDVGDDTLLAVYYASSAGSVRAADSSDLKTRRRRRYGVMPTPPDSKLPPAVAPPIHVLPPSPLETRLPASF